MGYSNYKHFGACDLQKNYHSVCVLLSLIEVTHCLLQVKILVMDWKRQKLVGLWQDRNSYQWHEMWRHQTVTPPIDYSDHYYEIHTPLVQWKFGFDVLKWCRITDSEFINSKKKNKIWKKSQITTEVIFLNGFINK